MGLRINTNVAAIYESHPAQEHPRPQQIPRTPVSGLRINRAADRRVASRSPKAFGRGGHAGGRAQRRTASISCRRRKAR